MDLAELKNNRIKIREYIEYLFSITTLNYIDTYFDNGVEFKFKTISYQWFCAHDTDTDHIRYTRHYYDLYLEIMNLSDSDEIEKDFEDTLIYEFNIRTNLSLTCAYY